MTILVREAVRPTAISSPAVATTTSCDDARTKAADTFARRKYSRSRREIDDFIAQHYRSHGSTWIGRQFGMNIITIIMGLAAWVSDGPQRLAINNPRTGTMLKRSHSTCGR